MRIGVGAQVGIVGGPATYARELTMALAHRRDDAIVVFTDQPSAFSGAGVETVRVPLQHAWQQLTWDHVALPGLLARSGVQIYHGTKNVLPWRLPVPGVLTVHDLAPYRRPETFAWQQRLHFHATVPWSVRRAARVIADSAHARDDLLQQFALPPDRVALVPLAVSPAFLREVSGEAVAGLRTTYGLSDRIVACVGTIQPRKHVERVVEAFSQSGAGREGWQLVIAGRVRPGYRPPWMEALPAGAVYLGALDDDALRALYAAADIAVSASDYEGFGLTILEAMAHGCAVVAVAATSVPEVVGDAGVLVARSETPLLTAALRTLIADPQERQRIASAAALRARTFTWEATATATRAVYEDVLLGGRR